MAVWCVFPDNIQKELNNKLASLVSKKLNDEINDNKAFKLDTFLSEVYNSLISKNMSPDNSLKLTALTIPILVELSSRDIYKTFLHIASQLPAIQIIIESINQNNGDILLENIVATRQQKKDKVAEKLNKGETVKGSIALKTPPEIFIFTDKDGRQYDFINKSKIDRSVSPITDNDLKSNDITLRLIPSLAVAGKTYTNVVQVMSGNRLLGNLFEKEVGELTKEKKERAKVKVTEDVSKEQDQLLNSRKEEASVTTQPTQAPVSAKVEVEANYYTPELLRANPNKIYVFGDNNQREGKKGQAAIRDEPNAMGISTKLRPSADEDAFMRDNQIKANAAIIDSDIAKIKATGKTVVFPKDGLGTGLAALKSKAPNTYEYLVIRLKEEFGFNNNTGELVVSLREAFGKSTQPITEPVEKVKPGVSELFESDQILANAVYEALGFNQLITSNDRIVFGHPTIGKSFLKNQGEDKFISLDDDYATEINSKVKEIADKYNVTTYQVKDGGIQKWNNEYNQIMQEMFNVAKQRAISENKTLFTSNTNLLRNNAESFDKVINLTDKEFERRIQERGAKYDIKEWKSQINEAISKLPTNKVINTDKYLSDLFITPQQKQQAISKFQEYVNATGKQDIEGFKEFVSKEKPEQIVTTPEDEFKNHLTILRRNKNKYQKSLNEELGESKAKEAEKWFKNKEVQIQVIDNKTGKPKTVKTTLSKLWDLKVLFNAINIDNPHSIATFVDNQITLYKGSDFTDIYHEAWHGFTQSMLTFEQVSDLYEELRKQKSTFVDYLGNTVRFNQASMLQLEEFLAEEFRKYAISDGKYKIEAPIRLTIFEKILNWFKAIFTGVTKADVILAPLSIPMVYEMYDKLYKGDLAEFTLRELSGGILFNKIVNNISNPTEQLFTTGEWEKIENIINSIISTTLYNVDLNVRNTFDELIDKIQKFKDQQTEEDLETLQNKLIEFIDTNDYAYIFDNPAEKLKFVTDIIEDKDNSKSHNPDKNFRFSYLKTTTGQNNVFDIVKNKIKKVLEAQLQKRAEAKTSEEIAKLDNNIELLEKVLLNYSDGPKTKLSTGEEVDNYIKGKNGVIPYYKNATTFLTYDELNPEDDELSQKGEKAGDKKPQAVSLENGLSPEIKSLLRGIMVYKDNKPKLDDFGLPQPQTLQTTLRNIFNVVSNSAGGDEIIRKLEIDSESNTLTKYTSKQVLNLLGNNESLNSEVQSIWTAFFTGFDKDKIRNVISKYTILENGFQHTSTDKTIANDTLLKKLKIDFEKQNDGNFIKTDNGTKVVDVKAIRQEYDFTKADKDKYQFLYDIGIKLSDNQQVREKLSKLKSFGFFWRGKFSKDGKLTFEQIWKDQGTIKKEILDIEIEYGKELPSMMIETATGNVMFINSDKSSVTTMVDVINSPDIKNITDYDSFKGGVGRFFNYQVYKNKKGNAILSSLFEQDGTRNTNFIKVNNNNGLQVLSGNEEFGYDTLSVTTLDALFSDLQTWIQNGKLKGPQPETKKTNLFIYPEQGVLVNGKINKHYFSPQTFITSSDILFDNQAFKENLSKHVFTMIERELYRVLECSIVEKEKLTTSPLYQFIVQGKKRYSEVGQDFTDLKNMISENNQNKLKTLVIENIEDAGSLFDYLSAYNSELLNNIEEDIFKYFQDKTDNFITRTELQAKDANLARFLDNDNSKYTTKINDLIRLFWINDFVNKFEIINLFYGDMAQYKSAMDFTKRDAGGTSTKLASRTDIGYQKYQENQKTNEKYINAYSNMFSNPTVPGLENYKGIDIQKAITNSAVDVNFFNSVILADAELKSYYFDQYKEYIVNKIKTNKKISQEAAEKEADNLLSAYTEMTEDDAQGWITLPAYKRISEGIGGKWTKEQDDLFNKILTGEVSTSISDFLEFFPIKKMQYWGPYANIDAGYSLIGFHKFSLLPLVPSTIGNNSNLRLLHDRMIEQGIDYATVKSGSKIGNFSPVGKSSDGFYKGDITDRKSVFADPNFKFTVNKIFSAYFGEQVATNEYYKNTVTFSTQLKKLAEIGLYSDGAPVAFMPVSFGVRRTPEQVTKRLEAWENLSEDKKTTYTEYNLSKAYLEKIDQLIQRSTLNLREKYGLDENYQPIDGNVQKLIDRLKKDFKQYSATELEYFEVSSDLSISPNAQNIEKVINSIVDRNIIKAKLKGEALILAANTGFENYGGIKSQFTNPTKEQLEQYGDNNSLTSYTEVKDSKGKTIRIRAMKVKIALQGDFKKLLDHKSVKQLVKENPQLTRIQALNQLIKNEEWLKDNRELITMVGVRIPVQGPNSMEVMEVYEFLPENAGNMIIPPSSIVAKAGSDFDIDKLTVLMPSILKTIDSVKLTPFIERSTKKLSQLKTEIKDLTDGIEEVQNIFWNGLNTTQQKLLQSLHNERKTKIKALNDKIASSNIEEEKDQLENQKFEIILEYAQKEKEVASRIPSFKLALETRNKSIEELTNKKIELEEELASKGNEGAQNELMKSMIDIILRPDNFSSLILPNGTYLIKYLATDEKQGLAEIKSATPTNIFEYNFNEDVRIANSMAMGGLGIGAIQNAANAAFNKIGMYVQPITQYSRGQLQFNEHVHTLLFSQFNKKRVNEEVKVGEDKKKKIIREIKPFDAILLSSLNSEDLDIPEVLSQFINGWVDVAKDAWVYDINATRDTATALTFLIKAGVPLEEAVYFINQPIILEYLDYKNKFSGPNARLYDGKAPSKKFWENKDRAREKLINKYSTMFRDQRNAQFMDPLYTEVINDNKNNKNFTDSAILKQRIEAERAKIKRDGKSYVPEYNQTDIDRLIHFFHIEDMSDGISKFTNLLNFDTKRQVSFYDVLKLKSKIETIEDKKFIPRGLWNQAVKDTVQTKYNPTELALNMFGKTLLSLRTNPVLLDYITSLMNDDIMLISGQDSTNYKYIIENTRFTPDEFYENFIDKLVPFVFQNILQSVNTQYDRSGETNYYKGYTKEENEKKFPIKETRKVKLGAFVKDGVIYIDKKILNFVYTNKLYTSKNIDKYNELTKLPIKLAGVESESVFSNYDQFEKFVIEREVLRSIYNTPESYQNDYEYKELLKDKKDPMVAYENFLVQRALFNTYNYYYMFQGQNSYAKRFENLPDLSSEDYPILTQLVLKESAGINNLAFISTINTPVEKDNITNQLSDLANSAIKKVDDQSLNEYISRFFSQFSIMAYLQGNYSTKKDLTFTVARDSKVMKLLEEPIKDLNKTLNNSVLNIYKQKFVDLNYRSNLTRYITKNWEITDSNSLRVMFNKERPQPVEKFEAIVIDNPVGDNMYGEFNYVKGNLSKVGKDLTDPRLSKYQIIGGTTEIIGGTTANKNNNKTRVNIPIDQLDYQLFPNTKYSAKTVLFELWSDKQYIKLNTKEDLESFKNMVDSKIKAIKDYMGLGIVPLFTPIAQGFSNVIPSVTQAPVKAVADIPQNKVSGIQSYGSLVTANDTAIKALGPNPHSIDMIEAGFRTRTTRSETEMTKYAIKVGDVIKHFGKSADGTTKTIYARVTAIHPKGTPGWKGTWEKEGWKVQDVDVIDRFKNGAAAIEFEVIKPTTATVSEGITFQEDQNTGYAERTKKNASADATIAIAVDFNSTGEKLTKRSVLEQGKKYIPIDANSLSDIGFRANKIVEILNSVNAKTLNIAGNGIYTMKGKYTQQQVDDFTYDLLKAVVESPNLKNKITSIRTGGQTGFDEAGAKAGIRLGVSTTILAPKGWKFRDVTGKDISNEQQFKARFSITQSTIPSTQPTVTTEVKSIVDTIYNKEGFNYLSSQIYENFGYINKGFDISEAPKEIILKFTPVTDQDVIDFINKCFIKP